MIKGIGGFYYVRQDSGEVHETHACGRFRKEGRTPIVGDRVVISEGRDSVLEILPRKCEFVRPPVANIDQMIVVVSIASPRIDLRLTDTMLFGIETRNVDAVLCVNKSDLEDKDKSTAVSELYRKAGYKAIVTSAEQRDGGDELAEILKGKISALAGNSGVGKSSLLNLIEKDYALKTGVVSKRVDRGMHTTRHVELMPLSFGGFVLDTPGFGKLDLPKMTSDKVADYFREFEKYKDDCRFSGCSHTSEKDCGIIEAVAHGDIARSRHESYKAFYNELKDYRDWQA